VIKKFNKKYKKVLITFVKKIKILAAKKETYKEPPLFMFE